MTSQPEKLFRDKLENFQRQAPAAAWGKIEAGLDKKKYKRFWLKIAAGLVLLAVAAFILWPASPTENTQPAYSKGVRSPSDRTGRQLTNTNTTTPKTEGVEKNDTEKNVTALAVDQVPVQKRSTPKNKFIKKDEPVWTAELKPVRSGKTTSENNIVPVVESETQVAVAEIYSAEEIPSRTIVYTAEEVNAKFLRKKSPAEATQEEKKTSGIQKLMGLAYNLKNNDNGLGDLRQKKDEILALNFLNNEDKTNKRKN